METPTTTLTLADFLLARIAQDEDGRARNLRDFAEALRLQGFSVADYLDGEATRVLAECEAKRRIVDDPGLRVLTDQSRVSVHGGRILRYLALPYADHPDYRDEWRP